MKIKKSLLKLLLVIVYVAIFTSASSAGFWDKNSNAETNSQTYIFWEKEGNRTKFGVKPSLRGATEGAAAGAAVGAAVGGPPGAVIGAAIGGVAGWILGP